jgi:hypothetical protein
MMRVPNITGYRIESVEIPIAKDEEQIIREAIGLTPPTPSPGSAGRRLRITIEGDRFPIGERSFEIRIGDQRLTSLAITGGGTSATGFLDRMPEDGEAIAFHVSPPAGSEPRVLVAENFDRGKLIDATA